MASQCDKGPNNLTCELPFTKKAHQKGHRRDYQEPNQPRRHKVYWTVTTTQKNAMS